MTADRLGVCSWSYQRPLREVADEMAKIGVKGIDLALTPFVAPDGRHGVEEGEEALAFAKAQFASGAWRLFATMISFPQEDYSTLETIRKTGGVVPDDCWPRNREIAAAAAELSGTLGAPYMLFHAGHLGILLSSPRRRAGPPARKGRRDVPAAWGSSWR